ncbi:hypothetical protein [Amycolatopsis kentuckyensis]|uniref:hypothetical protein n=1 Tax=Amycolatopsis kentuckyensis TaxID=218823 RepID=UPI00356A4F5A
MTTRSARRSRTGPTRPAATPPDDLVELDELLEIASGRRAPYTQLGDWVALSGVSDHAKALYWHLSMHLNQTRSDHGDFTVWPTRETLADWCGFSRPQSVDRYIDELAEIDAVEKYTKTYGNGMRRRNVYVVNQEPPEDYAGPKSLKEFYARRRATAELDASSAPSPTPNYIEFGKSAAHAVVRPSAQPVVRSSAPPVVRPSAPSEVRPSAPRSARPSAPRSVRPAAQKPDQVQPDEPLTTTGNDGCLKFGTVPAPAEPVEVVVDPELMNTITAMLAAIPVPADKRAPGRRSAKLQEVAQRCHDILAAPERYGLVLEQLRAHLAADLDTVTKSVVGCWLYRLRDNELPWPEQPSPTIAPVVEDRPACSNCGARSGEGPHARMIERGDGKFVKCSCHPHASPRPTEQYPHVANAG